MLLLVTLIAVSDAVTCYSYYMLLVVSAVTAPTLYCYC